MCVCACDSAQCHCTIRVISGRRACASRRAKRRSPRTTNRPSGQCGGSNRLWRNMSARKPTSQAPLYCACMLRVALSLTTFVLIFAAIYKYHSEDARDGASIWPTQSVASDRIASQLQIKQRVNKRFSIFVAHEPGLEEGAGLFQLEQCSVKACAITRNHSDADALVFVNSDVKVEPSRDRRAQQVWIAYLLESPVHTYDSRLKRAYRGVHTFNWTATYRRDSELVTPYAKFVPYTHTINRYLQLPMRRNLHDATQAEQSRLLSAPSTHKRLLAKKSNAIAWLVSNCHARNNRLEYARELSKHIPVHIYGKCGEYSCDKRNQSACLSMINERYKFYLAFENSNCREYITEKLFVNALGYNDANHLLVPIVMGPPRVDYELMAPRGSFIHVRDFASPSDLAKYLQRVSADDALYYSYFQWKQLGRFVDTKFMCRLCALLHQSELTNHRTQYSDIKYWWNYYGEKTHDKPQKACEDH